MSISPEQFRLWGDALGSHLPRGAKFLVAAAAAADPALVEELIAGLARRSLDLVLLGDIPPTMLDYARRRLQAAGSAIVLPEEAGGLTPGLRWAIGPWPLSEDQRDEFRTLLGAADRAATGGRRRPRASKPPAVRDLDVTFDYVAFCQEYWVDALGASLRIVVDPQRGVFARKFRRYLQAVFPACIIDAVQDDPSDQPAGAPPHSDELTDLTAAVEVHRADLGLCIDRSGDRLTVVDSQGVVLSADELASVLLLGWRGRLAGRPVVCDVRFSWEVAEAARQIGTTVNVEWGREGAMCRRLVECGAEFGADATGRFYYGALDGGYDPFFAACHLVATLAAEDGSLATMRARSASACVTPEFAIKASSAEQAAIAAAIELRWKGAARQERGTIRVELPGGWMVTSRRPDETGIDFRFGAVDAHALEHLVDVVCDALGEAGDVLWVGYQNAVANGNAGARP